MTTEPCLSQRGRIWFEALTDGAAVVASGLRSVCVADAALGGAPARFIAVVHDAQNRFPRARAGGGSR
jgi:malonate decarboxylase gamma subunit